MLLLILIFQPDVKENLDHPSKLATNAVLSGCLWVFRWSRNLALWLLALVAATSTRIYHLQQWLQPETNGKFTIKFPHLYICQKQKAQQVCQHMTQEVDRQVLLQQLKSDYRQILLSYFTTDKALKEKIDKFINAVFCANIPVPEIIEIHMELIDEFSKHLRLEGRSDETLMDYRLTLIDILAHLCETYRGAILSSRS
ncbi:KaiA family protein [Anabaena subtropica]|uniref:Circadian clock oscillator protein KaiA n=1 Tax=Anabaena subtropica FACHB-260 TaxID=2692884 RepID=A0ABR8CL45_9NOST|nr:KaiA family protein [Anabaena subtropica]MBD2343481.1 KaiA family protein [Anabaena subtropica FACHB-260]